MKIVNRILNQFNNGVDNKKGLKVEDIFFTIPDRINEFSISATEFKKFETELYEKLIKKSDKENLTLQNLNLNKKRFVETLKIMKCLFEYIPYFGTFKKICNNIEQNFDCDRKLNLVILGETASGKSTFINSIFGNKVMPEDVLPTNAVITILDYGETDKIELHLENDEIREMSYDDFLLLVDQQAGQENIKLRKNTRFVKYYLPQSILKKINIIDTPGLNAVYADHEGITKNYLPQADAIFWIFSATKPGSHTEQQAIVFLEKFSSKSYGIMNKIDKIRPRRERNYKEHLYQITDTLKDIKNKFGAYFIDIIPYSSKSAFNGIVKKENNEIKYSNYKLIKNILYSELPQRANEIKNQSNYLKIISTLQALNNITDEFDSNFNFIVEVTDKYIAKLEDKKKMGRDWLITLDSAVLKIKNKEQRCDKLHSFCEELKKIYAVEQRKIEVILQGFIKELLSYDNIRFLFFYKKIRISYVKIFSVYYTGKIKTKFESVNWDNVENVEQKLLSFVDMYYSEIILRMKNFKNEYVKMVETMHKIYRLLHQVTGEIIGCRI